MATYFELKQKLDDALRNDQLPVYIDWLKKNLESDPWNYLACLFIARAYEAVGDYDNAASFYAHLLRIANLQLNREKILSEVQTFINQHNHVELIDIAKERFGPGSLEMPKKNYTKPRYATPTDIDKSKFQIENSKQDSNNLQHLSDKNHGLSTQIHPNEIKIRDLIGRGNQSFQKGELEPAYRSFYEAYTLGDRSYQTFLMLAQTLQRMGRINDALEFLDKGIRLFTHEQRLALLNLIAQICSSQSMWPKAIESYEILIHEEKRPAVKRFSRLQLSRIYKRIGDLEKAKLVLDQILSEMPQDQVTLRIRASLDQPVGVITEKTELPDDEDGDLSVDLSDEGVDLISPMLRRDLVLSEYRDEKILRQGGRPDVNDADRLLDLAEQAKTTETEFGERYPAFLEAAKAYSELPDGYYELERFYRALTRYAMLKGGALVAEIRRKVMSTSQPNMLEISRLQDSAKSYYLEALTLQVKVDIRYALTPLTNLLRAQIAYTLLSLGESVPQTLFQLPLTDILRLCHDHKNDKMLYTAYETVVAIGAASGNVWNQLQRLKGGPGVLWNMLEHENRRRRPYAAISLMIGKNLETQVKPGEVLKMAFLERRARVNGIIKYFGYLQQLQLSLQNIQTLNSQWQNFPHQDILLNTDKEILDGSSAILATLLPYRSRSMEERTSILFTARTTLERLLAIIQNSPTYWGRVGFEPLLMRWQVAIRNIEQQRLIEIQPKLVVRLDPPAFYQKSDFAEGGLIIQNIGRGTAEGTVMQIQLSTLENQPLLQSEETVLDEIPVGSTYHHRLKIPLSSLLHGSNVPYRLAVTITPIFRRVTLPYDEPQEFTLEISSGMRIQVEDIPWNEIEIPPEHLFKGREQFIEKLATHLSSLNRNKTYILYGLTRTGKSSILNYLSKRIDLQTLQCNGNTYRFVTFIWNIGTANAQSNAKDMWSYLLEKNVVEKLHLLVDEKYLGQDDVPILQHPGNVRFKDWELILQHLGNRKIYPVFLIDEFSYFRSLVDSKRIDASFLAAIRQFTIDGRASFVFAGTYDLRKLIRDPAYGITGQLVNAIETQVSRIDKEPAIELVQVMSPKLRFTPDAIEHILRLTYQIPYFIQLLCKNCALYAVNSGRGILGFPEVEAVVKTMTGEDINLSKLGVNPMPPGIFMNNMQTPTDPPEYSALISTICHLSGERLVSRMVTYPEIQAVWDEHRIRYFQSRLAYAIQELKDREVLIEGEDEGIPAYQISVDLFRRWWMREHKNFTLELDALMDT